jgi:RNA polymerase sigma-70 factor (ECF subfamily)
VNRGGGYSDYQGVDRVVRDALLVVRAQLGDRRSLTELVERWHVPVWRYVRRMLDRSGPADDVSQEVWAAVLKALPRLREPERFTPWLFTIARRTVVDHLREKYRPAEVEPDRAEDPDDAVLDRVQVEDGLAELPVWEREVLVLYYLQDLALDECAQVLGIPVGTVKSRLFRARRLLRDRLVEKGYPA